MTIPQFQFLRIKAMQALASMRLGDYHYMKEQKPIPQIPSGTWDPIAEAVQLLTNPYGRSPKELETLLTPQHRQALAANFIASHDVFITEFKGEPPLGWLIEKRKGELYGWLLQYHYSCPGAATVVEIHNLTKEVSQ